MFASCANSSDSNSDDGNNTGITDTGNNNNNSNNSNSGDNNNNSNSNDNNSNNSNSSSNGNNGNVNSDNNNNDANNNNSNGGNSNNGDSSPTLPGSVGKNPITETVKLYYGDNIDRYLVLKSDKTARYIDAHNDEEEIEAEFEYSYDENKNEIYMKVEKSVYENPFGENSSELMTYNEILSKLNKDCNVENARKYLKELYEDEKENFPNCNSYEEFEAENMKKAGFNSFADYVKTVKQRCEDMHKAIFSAQTTYTYEIKDGKITLIEKFTGVKNMFMESGCHFESNDSLYGGVYTDLAYFYENDVYYTGIPNTEENTISFLPNGGGKKVTATYLEDIAQETVTISFNGKDYVCEFYGRTFTQE